MIEFRVTMKLTSADLKEMLTKAEQIEREAGVGDSAVIKDWHCGDRVTVRVLIDQERARRKGLMK